MIRLKKYFSLPAVDRRLLLGASCRLLLAWLVIRILPFAVIVRTLSARQTGESRLTNEISRRIARAVTIGARNLPLTLPCLPQALAACWMLQARGAAPQLHYGLQAFGEGRFDAHVWVELDGKGIIGQAAAPEFVTLAIFPGSPNS